MGGACLCWEQAETPARSGGEANLRLLQERGSAPACYHGSRGLFLLQQLCRVLFAGWFGGVVQNPAHPHAFMREKQLLQIKKKIFKTKKNIISSRGAHTYTHTHLYLVLTYSSSMHVWYS